MSEALNQEADADTLALLLDSLEQPEKNRAQWVSEQQQYPAAIKTQVLEILNRTADLGPFEQPFDSGPDDSVRIGLVVGDYRLTQLIGCGGMGAVYLAERVRDFEHQCAIKLIRKGRMTDTSRAHFVRERQSLADMQHPYIAHLLDGGTTAEGDEFLVMEWIAGQPITDYCNSSQLNQMRILEVFGKVGQALEYAHAKLLVHGDIKPNNILVTADGTPKLLDFGIAQHLQQPPDTKQRALSRYFASPEQLEHKQLTVASDVFSLSTLLQVLLCGNTDSGNPKYQKLPAELRSIITRGRADLPQQRYANVTQLLHDCARFQKHQPVLAHGGNWTYLAGKFMQRHRLPVTAGILLAMSLITGTAVSLWQADIARTQKQQAEQFSETLVDLLNAPDPYADGSARTVEDMLDRAGEQLLSDDNILPAEVQSDLLLTLGQVYINIGAMEKARNIADVLQQRWSSTAHSDNESYAKAHQFMGIIASRTSEYAAAENNLELAYQWYQQHDGTSRAAVDNIYELGSLYLFSGEEQKARDFWAEAIQVFAKIEQPWVKLSLAQIYNDLGIADEFLGDFESARRNYLLSIEYFPSKESLAAATQLGNLASVERKIGHIERAIELLKQSLQMHYDVVGPEHKEVSMILSDLALAYVDNRQAVVALEYARQALDNALQSSGESHRNTAAAYFALGNAELINNNFDNARDYLQQALLIRQQLLGGDHQRTLDVAISMAEADCGETNLQSAGRSQLNQIITALQNEPASNRYYLERARQKLSTCQAI